MTRIDSTSSREYDLLPYWIGDLTPENATRVARKLSALLAEKRFLAVSALELFRYAPDVLVDQVLEGRKATRRGAGENVEAHDLGITIHYSYGLMTLGFGGSPHFDFAAVADGVRVWSLTDAGQVRWEIFKVVGEI